MTELRPNDLPRQRRALRRFLAIVTAWAFTFAPYAAIAQQNAGAAGADEAKDDAAEAQPAEAAPAPAGPTPTLFVLPTQGVKDEVSSIIPERIGELLRAELQGKRGADLLPTYQTLARQGGGSANAAVTDATQMYTSGIGLLTAGENERAAKTFQQSVDILEKNLGDLDNFNVLVDAYKNMALAYFLAGFDFDARKKMKVFANLRPDETLDTEKFPKELREIYEAEAKKVQKAGPGKLTITADSGEATVVIDGVEKGQTPATIEDVGYGYHYLVVRSPEGKVWAEQIRVRGRSKAQSFEAKLGAPAQATDGEHAGEPAFYSGLLGAIKSGKFTTEGIDPYLSELKTRTGADFIAWVVMAKKGSDYIAVPFVYDTGAGVLARGADVGFTLTLSNLRVGVNQLATQIIGAVGSMPEDALVDAVDLSPSVAVAAAPTKPAQPTQPQAAPTPKPQAPAAGVAVTPPPQVEEDDDDSNTWLWVGVGSAAVVAAGLIVGGVVLMADGGDDDASRRFDATLSW